MFADIANFPMRRSLAVWICRDGPAWLVLAGNHAWLHGSRREARRDAQWLAARARGRGMNRDIARALTAACALGRMGYAVFPCKPDKTPATPNGFKQAVKERAAIEDLWHRHPGVLVGVATGEMSGIAVLDIDRKHPEAWAWWEVHQDRLLPARQHRTRSGGLHLIYRHRPGLRCSAGLINRGVDVRADGGYIIWWPAVGLEVLADPGLKPWREWLMPLLAPPPVPSIAHRAIAARRGDLRPTLHRTLGIIRTVLDAREGNRNKLLFWATCRAREMVVADELDHTAAVRVLEALRDAAAEVGLPQREIDRTITSAMRSAA
jgi:Bifunctional DNA primase/polymerase, N-terminal